MHMGVSKAQGQTMLRNIARKAAKKDFTMTAEEQEFAFLATWAHASDVGKKFGQKTDGLTIDALVSLVDYPTLMEAAAIGAQLKTIAPVDRDGVISSLLNPTNFNPENLTPAQMAAVNKLLSVGDKESWGYRLQAYLDADKYLESKRNKTAFTPNVTTAIDMNSAGRAFLGADIGNGEVLKRIGLLTQDQWNAAQVDQTGNTQPYGSPRDYFLQIALDSGVEAAFGTDNKELGNKLKEQLSFFSDPEKNDRAAAFSKDFGKKVLMTTDYGKPANYHVDNALLFLNSHPEFADKMLPLFKNDLVELAKAINEIYSASLRKATSIWQQKLPKDIVKITQMMNQALAPKGYFGEPLSLGGFKYEDTGDYTEVAGEQIAHTKRVFDLNAAAEDKRTLLEKLERDAPGPGTRARNQIGPILGQYRESLVVMETLRYINGGKLPKDMLFALPVFDNFVLDAHSFLQFRHVANNIILPKIMAWDIQTNIKDDFNAKSQAFEEAITKGEDSVDIGANGEYYGVLYNLDAEYKFMKDGDPKAMTYGNRQLYELLHNPASGYIPPSATRPDSIYMTKAQVKNAVHTFARAKLFQKQNFESKTVNLLDKWAKQGVINKHDMLDRLKGTFEKGMAHFMT
jgi:peptidoglycan hydrolase-like protein with peptidoglycan-binding domain